MMAIDMDKKDKIYNALVVGMAPEDAYIYAGLTPDEMVWAQEDEEVQIWVSGLRKQLEFELLSKMKDGANKQLTVGKTDATQWLLERLYPRYSQKAALDIGNINFTVTKGEKFNDITELVTSGESPIVQ